jgi:hypothetical protein
MAPRSGSPAAWMGPMNVDAGGSRASVLLLLGLGDLAIALRHGPRCRAAGPPGEPGGWLLDHTDNYRHDGNHGSNPCIAIGDPCNTVGLVGVFISFVGVFIGPSGKYKRLVLP